MNYYNEFSRYAAIFLSLVEDQSEVHRVATGGSLQRLRIAFAWHTVVERFGVLVAWLAEVTHEE